MCINMCVNNKFEIDSDGMLSNSKIDETSANRSAGRIYWGARSAFADGERTCG